MSKLKQILNYLFPKSRRYKCKWCGAKERRNNKCRHYPPICPKCRENYN